MFCFSDATGEALGALLRPGNATHNDIADQLGVLDQAISGLPEAIAAGHRPGDDPGLVRRALQVRADSAGGTPGLARGFRARNVGFAVVARTNAQIQGAICAAIDQPGRWFAARDQSGEEREGAEVTELTDLVDLSAWPVGTRLIVRREPLHPGAQTSLLPDLEHRYWGHYTDATDPDPVDLDVHMRAHAHVEDHIRRLKSAGLERFPFTDLDANRAWLGLVCFADALVRWFQLLCLSGVLAKAEPKTLRWAFWHTPARIVRRSRRQIVRILDGWPSTEAILDAYRRVTLII